MAEAVAKADEALRLVANYVSILVLYSTGETPCGVGVAARVHELNLAARLSPGLVEHFFLCRRRWTIVS
jgi:hypothetical protein